jgi:hypothetical protein
MSGTIYHDGHVLRCETDRIEVTSRQDMDQPVVIRQYRPGQRHWYLDGVEILEVAANALLARWRAEGLGRDATPKEKR